MEYKLLNKNMTPKEIASLSEDERSLLCKEIRDKILNVVSKNGGHLASNLGVVELTVALLSVFDYTEDQVIFDVGHQSYAYKLLTGRFEQFDTLRKKDGISGFPRINESKYDHFDTGHSATSVSAAVGYARANELNDKNNHVIAVIGDGAMTGGPAYEAINDLGHRKDRVIVILNDNTMSIGKNVGGLAKHLSKVRLSSGYLKVKRATEIFLTEKIPVLGKPVVAMMLAIKDFFRFAIYRKAPTIFEELGLVYYGPVDGHNTKELINALESVKNINAPVLLHVCTKKGKGYRYAEKDPSNYHGVSSFELATGVNTTKSDEIRNFTDCFSKNLIDIANKNRNVVAISAAMVQGTGLTDFSERYPTRFYDCGIAEEHCVTMAGGLALGGKVPVVAIYSSFLQRAYDQILEDCCFMNNHVVFCLDRAGFVGPDGHTHNGLFDISYMLVMPNMKIFVPCDYEDLRLSLKQAINKEEGPCSIRYSKSSEYKLEEHDIFEPRVLADKGRDFAFITCGPIQKQTDQAFEILKEKGYRGININLCSIRPLNIDKIFELVKDVRFVFTVEEGIVPGGFGSYLSDLLLEKGYKGHVRSLGIKDPMIRCGTLDEQYRQAGLDPDSIADNVLDVLNKR